MGLPSKNVEYEVKEQVQRSKEKDPEGDANIRGLKAGESPL